jgi:hypothetical protein
MRSSSSAHQRDAAGAGQFRLTTQFRALYVCQNQLAAQNCGDHRRGRPPQGPAPPHAPRGHRVPLTTGHRRARTRKFRLILTAPSIPWPLLAETTQRPKGCGAVQPTQRQSRQRPTIATRGPYSAHRMPGSGFAMPSGDVGAAEARHGQARLSPLRRVPRPRVPAGERWPGCPHGHAAPWPRA